MEKINSSHVDRMISKIKSNPIVAVLVFLSAIVVSISSFTDASKKIASLFSKKSPESARIELGHLSLSFTAKDFIHSAELGDVNAVKLFLEAGMKPDATDRNGATALMFAAGHGQMAVVTELLKAGADTKKEENIATALENAASGGYMDIVRVLLNENPTLKVINRAFVAAAGGRQHEILRFLVNKGANVKQYGDLAMREVERHGWAENEVYDTIKYLLGMGADPKQKNADGWNALFEAASSGFTTVVRLLIDNGADVNARCDCNANNGGGQTGLLIATRHMHSDLVKVLINNGANVNVRDNKGETALILATRYNNYDGNSFKAILGSGADVNSKSREGRTALMNIAYGSPSWSDRIVEHPNAVQALLNKGAKVNVQDNEGMTPLMYAVLGRSTKVVNLLLQHGALVNPRTKLGNTALSIAHKELNGEVKARMVRLLKKAGAK